MSVHPTGLVQSLQDSKVDYVDREQRLQVGFAQVDLWSRYLFGRIEHMKDYEEMIESLRNEAISLGSIGLMRPALYALRSYFELQIAWVYYSEHPREWHACKVNGLFFLTPGGVAAAVEKYLPHLERNLSLVFKSPKKKIVTPYSELSRYVHSGDPTLVPNVRAARDILLGENQFRMLVSLSHDVSTYCFNWFSACLTPEHWDQLSAQHKALISSRVTDIKMGDFRKMIVRV